MNGSRYNDVSTHLHTHNDHKNKRSSMDTFTIITPSGNLSEVRNFLKKLFTCILLELKRYVTKESFVLPL